MRVSPRNLACRGGPRHKTLVPYATCQPNTGHLSFGFPEEPQAQPRMKESTETSDAQPVVFVVDDDPSVRKALARLLRARGLSVRTFESAASFLESSPLAESACVLVDLQMPQTNGLALQERMTDLGMLFPVVFVTGHGGVPESVRAMKGGAVDFLQKPFNEDVLIGAIEQGLELHADRKRSQKATEDAGERLSRLTPRETQVMELVAAGLRNQAVAERLGISLQTVKGHRGRVMRKLQADSLPDLVRLVESRAGRGTAIEGQTTRG